MRNVGLLSLYLACWSFDGYELLDGLLVLSFEGFLTFFTQELRTGLRSQLDLIVMRSLNSIRIDDFVDLGLVFFEK